MAFAWNNLSPTNCWFLHHTSFWNCIFLNCSFKVFRMSTNNGRELSQQSHLLQMEGLYVTVLTGLQPWNSCHDRFYECVKISLLLISSQDDFLSSADRCFTLTHNAKVITSTSQQEWSGLSPVWILHIDSMPTRLVYPPGGWLQVRKDVWGENWYLRCHQTNSKWCPAVQDGRVQPGFGLDHCFTIASVCQYFWCQYFWSAAHLVLQRIKDEGVVCLHQSNQQDNR